MTNEGTSSMNVGESVPARIKASILEKFAGPVRDSVTRQIDEVVNVYRGDEEIVLSVLSAAMDQGDQVFSRYSRILYDYASKPKNTNIVLSRGSRAQAERADSYNFLLKCCGELGIRSMFD